MRVTIAHDGRVFTAVVVTEVGGARVRLTGWDESREKLSEWLAMCERSMGIYDVRAVQEEEGD